MTRRRTGSQETPAARRLTDFDLVRLVSGEFVYRRCLVCEWEGQLAQLPTSEPGCPLCHAPTELVAVLQPMASSGAPSKNPHASELGRLGGQRGGPARAAVLSPKRRAEIARQAARARWSKRY